jgi:hypothetical protein
LPDPAALIGVVPVIEHWVALGRYSGGITDGEVVVYLP